MYIFNVNDFKWTLVLQQLLSIKIKLYTYILFVNFNKLIINYN